jgi:hypothetical protein
MLLFGQIAHAMANVLTARKLNDRAVPFSHVARRYEDPGQLGAKAGPWEPSRPSQAGGLRLRNAWARQKFLRHSRRQLSANAAMARLAGSTIAVPAACQVGAALL